MLQSMRLRRVRHDLMMKNNNIAVKGLGPTTWLHQTFQAFLKIEVELICVSDIGQSNSVIYTRFFSIICYWFGGGLAAQLC